MAIPTNEQDGTVGVRLHSPFHYAYYAVWVVMIGITFWVSAWEGELVLPLDDVYIHFQYAKQLVAGQPYQYNLGLAPSTGATSLLYPPLLAVGYALGWTDLSLGYWAIAWGGVAFYVAVLLLDRISLELGARGIIRHGMLHLFMITGFVGWHFNSGMETGLLVAFSLLTFYGIISQRMAMISIGASLAVITRPEGIILVALAVVIALYGFYRTRQRHYLVGVVLPLLATTLQPLAFYLFTHTNAASGSEAKSLLHLVPRDYGLIMRLIGGNVVRMVGELLTGYSPREGLYLPIFMGAGAGWGVWVGIRQSRTRLFFVALLGWMMLTIGAVATLDPAFWHLKRYQVPLMVMTYIPATLTLVWLGPRAKYLARAILALMLVSAGLATFRTFLPAYHLNVGYLRHQQLAMARWIDQHLPDDAVIAVHDVGMIRYLGRRTTVDMVGLTTADATLSWRNGVGALAEFLQHYEPRPTHVASYTDALGLSYLADTPFYGDLLVEFPQQIDPRLNVALAGEYQAVWEIDWDAMGQDSSTFTPYLQSNLEGATQVDAVDVAHLASETAHHYHGVLDGTLQGFPSEVYALPTWGCTEQCSLLDGGRRLSGAETFTMHTNPQQDAIWLIRVHPAHPARLDLYVNDGLIGTKVIPYMPGRWLEIPIYVASENLNGTDHFQVVPHVLDGGHYMPYHHSLYQSVHLPHVERPDDAMAWVGEHVALLDYQYSFVDERLVIEWVWWSDGLATDDVRQFVHVYADPTLPPVAQTDQYPLEGAFPVGNWLHGITKDKFMVDLSQLSDGTYQVMMGFYDAMSTQRIPLTAEKLTVLPDHRLILGTIEVK
jgi:hypothetical protein